MWDRETQELHTAPIDVDQNPGPIVLAVAEDGRTLIERSAVALPAGEITIREFDPDTGRMTTLDREHMPQMFDLGLSRIGPYANDHTRPSTGDLQHFAHTYVPWLTAPTAELRIARCN